MPSPPSAGGTPGVLRGAVHSPLRRVRLVGRGRRGRPLSVGRRRAVVRSGVFRVAVGRGPGRCRPGLVIAGETAEVHDEDGGQGHRYSSRGEPHAEGQRRRGAGQGTARGGPLRAQRERTRQLYFGKVVQGGGRGAELLQLQAAALAPGEVLFQPFSGSAFQLPVDVGGEALAEPPVAAWPKASSSTLTGRTEAGR